MSLYNEFFKQRNAKLNMKVCMSCGARFGSVSWECPSCHARPKLIDKFPALAPELADSGKGFEASYFAELVNIEPGNFWFCSRNRLIVWALRKYFPNANSLLEVGCGTGFVLSQLESTFPQLSLYGSDIFCEALAYTGKRLKKANLFQMDVRRIPFEDEFDVIGAFDVLEHVENDQLVLSQIYKAVRGWRGGIILTVPQHDFLWSQFDECSRHLRRYNALELKAKVEQAGFEVTAMTSFVSLLLPIVIISRLRQKGKYSEEYDVMRGLKFGCFMNTILTKVLDLERGLIRLGIALPFGGSLLLVARKYGGRCEHSF